MDYDYEKNEMEIELRLLKSGFNSIQSKAIIYAIQKHFSSFKSDMQQIFKEALPSKQEVEQ